MSKKVSKLKSEICVAEIQKILDKHNCEIVAHPVITEQGTIASQVAVVVKKV